MVIKTYGTHESLQAEDRLASMTKSGMVPDSELIKNLGLFFTPGTLGRILYINELYQKIVMRQGIIMEFGTRYGQNFILFNHLRSILEPYNRLRKIVCFDTFTGFPSVTKQDGSKNKTGDYNIGSYGPDNLKKILETTKIFSPISHLEGLSEIISGDVSKTLPKYLERNRQTLIALCYFDLDIYKPTLDSLIAVEPYLTKGSILAFDELNDPDMPGETIAFREFIKDKKLEIFRSKTSVRTSYVIWE